MDVDRTIELLLENQARFDARLGALTEVQSRNQQMIGQLAGVVGKLAAVQQRANDNLEELRRRTEEEQQRAQAAERRLEEKLENLTDNMNALVKTVDELIRRDGRGPAV
jgi:molecular chaperone GrpE (heat shock protein)